MEIVLTVLNAEIGGFKMEKFEMLFYVALCAAGIGFTITTTSMFYWLRELVSPIHHKIEELIHCPWCLGHYIVLIIMLLSKKLEYIVIFDIVWMDFIFTWFVIISMMGILQFVLLRAFKPVAQAMTDRALSKLNK